MGREMIQSNKKIKGEMAKKIEQINYYSERYAKELGFSFNDFDRNLPNDEERERGREYFTAKTNSLRNEIKSYISLGYTEEEALSRVLPKAYGLVKTASAYLWKKPHYDVQLQGGILLNDGFASQMATGEGKTLTAMLPAYLNALLGKGSHVITPNGYLAKRDYEEASKLFEILGLSCGLATEKGKLDPEDIEKKKRAILQTAIEAYAKDAKTDEERRMLTEKFFTDRKNKKVIQEAKEKAIKALQVEDILRRREAYLKDITYGSSQAFAFDYLFDDLETDLSNLVQRTTRPNFAVIDEVDAVLFDDATTPFTLSGTEKDEELAITDEEKQLRKRKIDRANNVMVKISEETSRIRKRENNNESLVLTVNDDDSYEALVRNETDQAEVYNMTRAIIINDNTKEYIITTLGDTIIFSYYRDKEVNRLLKDNLDLIVGLQFEDGPMYREGYDYIINEYGRIEMEPRAFAHLVTSGVIPELTLEFNDFCSNEYFNYRAELDNAIKAWYILKEDVDYKLSTPSNPTSEDEKIVSLVMNGRTAEGRVYSNGLQQAIEAKIKFKKNVNLRETEIKNTLTSIPTASFFARYEKFGGMTGTSAVEAFRNLYGLDTREVDRHRKKQSIDYGDRLYATTEEKNEAIFQEVLKSYQKQQPVLISTISIGESVALYKYLQKRLKESGIEIEIPVLNANVSNLEEEANIVSRAGLPGAITIATEMAGRGTDIKLGGELPELEDLIPVIKQELGEELFNKLKKAGALEKYGEEQLKKAVNRQINSISGEELNRRANERLTELSIARNVQKTMIEQAGGLKVIGSGHFAYSRVDDQVKGRCGRQGDPGEIIFFVDPDDLLSVGVERSVVERLEQQAKLSPIIEDPQTGRTPVSDAVYNAQQKTERIVEASIKQSQEVEREVSHYRSLFRHNKEELRQTDDYIDVVRFMIEENIKSTITSSSRIENPHFTDKTRLKHADIDYEELSNLLKEFNGIDISVEELSKFRTLKELREFVTEQALDKFEELVASKDKEEFNLECRDRVFTMLNRTWNGFEGLVDNIKHQTYLNSVAGYQGGLEVPTEITIAYKYAVESERAMLVRDFLYNNYKNELENPKTELSRMRLTPSGFRKATKKSDEQDARIMEVIEEEKEELLSASVRNLQPHPRMFTLVNKTRINRESGKVGTNSNASFDSEVETVSFSDESPKKR